MTGRTPLYPIIAVMVLIGVTTAPQMASSKPRLAPKPVPKTVPQTESLAEGPFSKLEMILEKSIFSVDVMKVTVQFGTVTRDRMKDIAQGKPYSDALAKAAVGAAIEASIAQVQVLFLRDIDYDTYLSETITGVRCVLAAGMISAQDAQQLDVALVNLLSPLKERGVMKNDLLMYDVNHDKLHITYRTPEGQTLIDQTELGPAPRKTVLGSYFASCSEFSQPLIKSLFE